MKYTTLWRSSAISRYRRNWLTQRNLKMWSSMCKMNVYWKVRLRNIISLSFTAVMSLGTVYHQLIISLRVLQNLRLLLVLFSRKYKQRSKSIKRLESHPTFMKNSLYKKFKGLLKRSLKASKFLRRSKRFLKLYTPIHLIHWTWLTLNWEMQ